jgi:hypothetical protein
VILLILILVSSQVRVVGLSGYMRIPIMLYLIPYHIMLPPGQRYSGMSLNSLELLHSLFLCSYFYGKIFFLKLQVYLFINKTIKVVCCLMILLTIFQLYRGGQVYLSRKPYYLEKKLPTCRKSRTNFIT